MGESVGEAVMGIDCRSGGAEKEGVEAAASLAGGVDAGIAAASGTGAELVLVGVGSAFLIVSLAETVEEVIAPVSRLTRFGFTSLPAKKSLPDSAGSADGARGKISPWNESALRGTMKAMGSMKPVPVTL